MSSFQRCNICKNINNGGCGCAISGTLQAIHSAANEGKKFDSEKPDLSLCPKEALEEMAKAFQWGEKKYGRYNYRSGMDWHRLIAATLRHITAFNEGEDLDSESGYNHLGHALASISMLLVYVKNDLGKDTRYKK